MEPPPHLYEFLRLCKQRDDSRQAYLQHVKVLNERIQRMEEDIKGWLSKCPDFEYNLPILTTEQQSQVGNPLRLRFQLHKRRETLSVTSMAPCIDEFLAERLPTLPPETIQKLAVDGARYIWDRRKVIQKDFQVRRSFTQSKKRKFIALDTEGEL